MTVKKRGGRWHFSFQIKGVRYREAIPEARTKFQAEQAETKARDQVFQGTYGTSQLGNQGFREFVSETYLPWAKANKRTWRNDEIIANQWAEIFKGKSLREVSPLAIEKWKRDRAQSNYETRHNSQSGICEYGACCTVSHLRSRGGVGAGSIKPLSQSAKAASG
jgi:hypothetical protein